MARNPKDVIFSFYFHHRYLVKLQGCEAPIDEFAQYFMDDEGTISLKFINNLT